MPTRLAAVLIAGNKQSVTANDVKWLPKMNKVRKGITSPHIHLLHTHAFAKPSKRRTSPDWARDIRYTGHSSRSRYHWSHIRSSVHFFLCVAGWRSFSGLEPAPSEAAVWPGQGASLC